MAMQGAGAATKGDQDADAAVEGVETLLDDTFAQVSGVISPDCRTSVMKACLPFHRSSFFHLSNPAVTESDLDR